jgi:RNA polymerase sigma factor (sigma-70 family)
MDAEARGALEEAFRTGYLPLLRLMVLLTGRQDVAEEIVQETFVRLATRVESLPGDEAIRYGRRIAVNLWKRRLRRTTLERRYGDARASGGTTVVDAPENEVTARESMWRALLRLPRKQRLCIVLRYYEDLPYAEIADVVGCSVGAVKSNISRGIVRLREEFPE